MYMYLISTTLPPHIHTTHRNPSIPEELSFYAASCLKCTRKMSAQYERRTSHPFTLSPPGSSDLALRREYKS